MPGVLDESPDDFAESTKYLTADPTLVDKWREKLGNNNKFRIGIAWQGNPTFSDDRSRSIPLTEYSPLGALKEIEVISLQKDEAGTKQIQNFTKKYPLTIVDKSLEKERAFMDTASIIMNLDLVVTSDTSVAHLAGALGAPVWVLLAKSADWRWLKTREDSPWYPSMRLFRQKESGNWQQVFQNVLFALAEIQKKINLN